MTARSAFRDGIRRVNEAPVLVAGMVLTTLLIALPLSIALEGLIDTRLGQSAAAGTDYDWWLEFATHTPGLGATFTPSVIGFAAVLENTSALLDNTPVASAVGSATVAWLVVWSFLSGGVIDRYARRRSTRAYGFFAASGMHFWRFLRLGVVAWLVHAALFGVVHFWIFQAGYARMTQDLTSERTALALRLAGYLVFSALLAVFALLFDYARVRIVVEDRRSSLASLVAAARFLTRHKARAGGLLLLNGAAYLLLVAAYGALSPGAPRTDMHLWLVLGLGQAYIVGRHYLKLLVYASETALFQGALAHAAYTAAPVLVWPESPAVETITNAEPTTAR